MRSLPAFYSDWEIYVVIEGYCTNQDVEKVGLHWNRSPAYLRRFSLSNHTLPIGKLVCDPGDRNLSYEPHSLSTAFETKPLGLQSFV
jgi:hypothetical protein